jgi:hypothetical protein
LNAEDTPTLDHSDEAEGRGIPLSRTTRAATYVNDAETLLTRFLDAPADIPLREELSYQCGRTGLPTVIAWPESVLDDSTLAWSVGLHHGTPLPLSALDSNARFGVLKRYGRAASLRRRLSFVRQFAESLLRCELAGMALWALDPADLYVRSGSATDPPQLSYLAAETVLRVGASLRGILPDGEACLATRETTLPLVAAFAYEYITAHSLPERNALGLEPGRYTGWRGLHPASADQTGRQTCCELDLQHLVPPSLCDFYAGNDCSVTDTRSFIGAIDEAIAHTRTHATERCGLMHYWSPGIGDRCPWDGAKLKEPLSMRVSLACAHPSAGVAVGNMAIDNDQRDVPGSLLGGPLCDAPVVQLGARTMPQLGVQFGVKSRHPESPLAHLSTGESVRPLGNDVEWLGARDSVLLSCSPAICLRLELKSPDSGESE